MMKCHSLNIHRLTTHIQTHAEERPFECKQCAKRYSTKSKLAAHWKRHHVVSPYNCARCLKGFAQIGLLHEHLRTVHRQ